MSSSTVKTLTPNEQECILDLRKRGLIKGQIQIVISTEFADQHRKLELAASKIERDRIARPSTTTITL